VPRYFLSFGNRSITSLVIGICVVFATFTQLLASPSDPLDERGGTQASLAARLSGSALELSGSCNRARAGATSHKRGETEVSAPELAFKPQQGGRWLSVSGPNPDLDRRAAACAGRSPPLTPLAALASSN